MSGGCRCDVCQEARRDDIARFWWFWIVLGFMFGTLLGWALVELAK